LPPERTLSERGAHFKRTRRRQERVAEIEGAEAVREAAPGTGLDDPAQAEEALALAKDMLSGEEKTV
jgi:hypothetical protein